MDKLNISPADHDRFVSNVYFTSFYTQLDKIGNILKLSLNEYTYSNDRKIWYLNESVIKIGLFSILPELRELHIRDDKGAIAKTGSELFLGLDKLETLLIERVDKNTLPKGLFLHLPNLKYIYLHQIDYFYKKYMKIFKWGSFFPIDSPTESDVEYLRTTFPIELLDLPQLKFIYTFSGLIRRGDFDKIRKINKASRKEIYEMFKEPEPDMPVVSKSEGGSNPLS